LEIERLEKELSAASADFRGQRAARLRGPADIRKALPAGAVLIDLLQYNHLSRPKNSGDKPTWEYRMVAFVVGRDRPIARVELGPTRPMSEAVDAWRKTLGRVDLARNAGAPLRRLLWEPLTPHLQGARAVLISPDGPLTRLPFAALPGQSPDRYLLEEVAVAVVPVPQQLPDLMATGKEPGASPSLLLVGRVDYGAAPGQTTEGVRRPAPRGRSQGTSAWRPLPATGPEIDAIAASFRQTFPDAAIAMKRDAKPTEAEVCRLAGTYRFVHFATHGYFAPPQVRSALAMSGPANDPAVSHLDARQQISGFHPALLSGLVLAGANRPLDPERDDGILTALEVAALNLEQVELATLSACETGLGETAGGEGVLGLQRAFHTAGARTVVTSLWSVDDAATQKLMTRFYENFWQKKLPKLEALRQAQLSILYELPDSSLPRGLEVVHENQADAVRADPRLWAAWVLSGDPGDLSQIVPVTVVPPTGPAPTPEARATTNYLIAALAVGVLLGAIATVVWKRRWSRRAAE